MNQVRQMRDFLRKTINVSDVVVARNSGTPDRLFKAEVIGFTPKRVRVKYYNEFGFEVTALRDPKLLIIVTKNGFDI